MVASPGSCATSYVAGEWSELTAVDFGTGIVEWPIGGGARTIASSSINDLGIYPEAVITISGNASIASFGSSLPQGRAKWVTFTGTPVLVNSSNLLLPGGANITVQAGDAAAVLSLGGGINQLLYQPARQASGVPLQQYVTSGGAHSTTITSGDVLVNVNAAVTLTLPTSGPITVIDDGGFAEAHPITVVPASGTINNGAGSWIIDNAYGSARFVYDGTNYRAQPLPQTVPSAATLQSLPSTQFKTVSRLGFLQAGDGGEGVYAASGSACSLNSGNGDGGSQVKSSDNKCWVLVPDATGVSPKVWGAVGNGVADDSAPVSACFVYSSSNGVPCRIPAATFVIDDIALPSPLVIISDTPAASKFLRKPSSSAGGGMLHCYRTIPTGCSHTRISGITIDGNKTNETVASTALNIGEYTDVVISNVTIINAKGDGIGLDTSVDQAANTHSSLSDVVSSNNDVNGINVVTVAWGLVINNATASFNGGNGLIMAYQYGVTPVADQLQYITVRGGEFSGNGAAGLNATGWVKSYVSGSPVYGPGISPVSNIKVLGVTATDNFRYGIVVQAKNAVVSDSIGRNNNTSSTYGGDFLGPCTNCEWNNLTSEGPGLIGLDVGTGQNAHVRGGSFSGSGYGINIGASSDSDIRGATVRNNSVGQISAIAAEQSGDGFGIEGYTQRMVVAGNRLICGSGGVYGLRQWNGGIDIEVSDNYVSGCDANLALTMDAYSSVVKNNIVASTNLGSGYDAVVTAATTTLTIPPWADVVQLLGTNNFSNVKTVEQTAIGTGAASVQITNGGAGYTNGAATATFTGCSVSPTGTVNVNRGGLVTGYTFATSGSGCSGPTIAFGGGGTGATGTVYTAPLFTSRKELTLIVGPSATLTIGGGGNVTLASALSGLAATSAVKFLRAGSTLFETGRVVH